MNDDFCFDLSGWEDRPVRSLDADVAAAGAALAAR